MEQDNCTTGDRKYKHFREKERYKLEGYLEGRVSVKEAALRLDKHISTVYREIKRGTVIKIKTDLSQHCVYRANVAHKVYAKRVTNRERSLKIGKDRQLEAYIRKRILNDLYSPDAVIGEIKLKGLSFERQICVKTLYSYIDRGFLSGISNESLWEKRKRKKKKHNKIRRISLRNKDSKSIEERSIKINERQEYGHWEGDCVKGPRGKDKTSLFVLTERLAREQIIIKISRTTHELIKQAIDELEKKHAGIFKDKFKSITFDNGSEFLDWESIEQSSLSRKNSRTVVYFAHPFSSWERGTNENQNRMIRRFIPKGTNIAKVADKEIETIQNWMNNYPRKILGYKTANEMVLELTNDNRFLS
jgi:transposase, IS30 family